MRSLEKVTDIAMNVGLIFIVGVGSILTLFLTIKMGQAFFADISETPKIELVEHDWNCIEYNAEDYKYTTTLIVGKTIIPQTHTGTRNVCVKYERVK